MDQESWAAGYEAALRQVKQDDEEGPTTEALGRLAGRLADPSAAAQAAWESECAATK